MAKTTTDVELAQTCKALLCIAPTIAFALAQKCRTTPWSCQLDKRDERRSCFWSAGCKKCQRRWMQDMHKCQVCLPAACLAWLPSSLTTTAHDTGTCYLHMYKLLAQVQALGTGTSSWHGYKLLTQTGQLCCRWQPTSTKYIQNQHEVHTKWPCWGQHAGGIGYNLHVTVCDSESTQTCSSSQSYL